ncbi:MAG: sugar transferase [Phycisphaerae bacterium]|jgi:lipopolysaccharide/colanic/teichoic acid biosynthesis glycosyltransferase
MPIRIFIFVVDMVLVNAAFLLSFLFRYGVKIPDYNFTPYRENFIYLTSLYAVSFLMMKGVGRKFRSYWELFKSVFNGCLFGTLFNVGLMYVFRHKWQAFPSSVFAICLPVMICLIFMANLFLFRKSGRFKKEVIVIGKGEPLEIFGESGLLHYTYIDNIEDLMHYEDVDEVVILERIHEDKQLNLLIYLLLKLKVNVVFGPAIYAELLSENVMEENSLQFLATFIGRKSDHEEFLIRNLDVVGSLVLLIIFAPIMAVVAAIIKLTSSGSVFYKQARVAQNGGTFELYKFKTMINDAEKHTGPVWAGKNDPRVTKVGRLLRNTRLDELPQLINVIKGDMSLVGPRPERPHFAKMHKSLRQIRLAVRPGLTGFAQIRQLYDLHPRHKEKYDYLYIQRRSFLLNLYILIMTIPVIISRKGQ